MNPVIELRNVKKLFPAPGAKRTAFGSLRKRFVEKTSLNGHGLIALEVPELQILRGYRLAVIGNNGAGKTTLLKIIAGLYQPTSGEVRVDGEITLIAGLAIGMMEELSVEENTRLYGMIYGMEKSEIQMKLPEILDWAELSDFRLSPLKTLSSGMKARLAFSATRHFRKDIYLLDEVLAAGDKNFKAKCEAVFEEYKQTTRTFVISTHDLKFAEKFCHAMWCGRPVRRACFADRHFQSAIKDLKSQILFSGIWNKPPPHLLMVRIP